MAMSASALAGEIAAALGESQTTEIEGFATGFVDGLKLGVATFGPPSGNTISGVLGPTVAGLIQSAAGYPSVSAELTGFGSGFATHIATSAIVTYTGPGPPAGFFTGGTISGLSGSTFASLVQAAAGYPSVSAELEALCTAVTDHIVANAEVVSGVIS